MLTPCEILRTFPFSRDGFTEETAVAGTVVDVPSHLVDGCQRDGLLKPVAAAKEMHAAPENKMINTPSPENKGSGKVSK